MCGVAGILNIEGDGVLSEDIRRMNQAIAHRGPDGEGILLDKNFGVGHRRLAILDLSSAGHQPMVTSDGRFVLSYNGEVYNFQELKKTLVGKGYRFQSTTDAEVVLNAFAEWGTECLNSLNGMFAFSVWDKKKRELILARDRYGIKPLYYSIQGDQVLFASEIKAILSVPGFRWDLDKKGLIEYFTFQNFFTERTLFTGIKLLPAGCYLKIKDDHKALAGASDPIRYWDYSFTEPKNPVDEREALEELDRLFSQAVRRQLVSDVPVGTYLSGGMDSGSITALASRQLPYMRSFTCGFDLTSASGLEMNFDERASAEYMSYLFKTEHYEMVLKAGDMERVIPALARHLEEPRVGQSYPNYYIAQLASKFVKVCLSGTGGDELFAGYPWRYYRAVVNTDFESYVDKYYGFWQRLIPESMMPTVFSPIWGEVSDVTTRDIFKNVFSTHAAKLNRPEDYLNHSLYFEAKTFLHGLLIVEDKLSMAHSLETRVPFLDHDLVDFAMKLPAQLKLGRMEATIKLNENESGHKSARYFQKARDGKILLRRMMERYLPERVTQREKQGFSAPDASWFKGESIDYVRQRLLNNRSPIYDYIDRQSVQNLVGEHLQGKENRRLLIWSLINFAQWIDCFMGQEAQKPSEKELEYDQTFVPTHHTVV